MKRPITLLLFFLFVVLLMNRADNNSSGSINLPIASEKVVSLDVSVPSPPEAVGMSSAVLSRIQDVVEKGIRAKAFPGCQILVMKDGKTIYDKCFGNYTYESTQKVQPTTMYDLASLSKTTGTLLAVMKLYDEGKLHLTDKASLYLPFLRGTDKEDITITQLLFHESGLPAGLPFHRLALEKKNGTNDTLHHIPLKSATLQYKQDWVSKVPSGECFLQVSDSLFVSNRLHDAAMQMIANTRLHSKTYLYSCVNFIVLKEIVETINGIQMDKFLDQEFYTPLHLNNMTYLPLQKHKKDEIAPTLKNDFLRNGILQGFVHDPDAAFLGGVSGNAGLFAAAHDVAKVYEMLLNQGELDGKRYLSATTCQLFTTTTSASRRRGLGFDKPVPANPEHSPCCTDAPLAVFGHTGYTGTCCWVDPVNKLIYVFLSNRTYPNDAGNKLSKMGIRPKIQELIYQSMAK